MKCFFLKFLVLLVTQACFAQQEYTFTNYIQEQRLVSGTIRGIYKDTTGFIWLTSEGSLARFDGYRFKNYHYNPDIPTGLPSAAYWEAVFPRFGDIYFGDKESIISYNPVTEIFSDPFGKSEEIISVNEAKGVKDCYWLRSPDNIYILPKTNTEDFSLHRARLMDYKKKC